MLDLMVLVYPVVVVMLGVADVKLRCHQIREEGGEPGPGGLGHAWGFIALQALVVVLVTVGLLCLPGLGWLFRGMEM